MNFRFAFLLLLLGLNNWSFSQRFGKCATVEYEQQLRKKFNIVQSQNEFEQWVQEKLKNNRISRSPLRTSEVTHQIPVVVHVIHNGEPVGNGANISLEQINSQMKIINDDFRRKNADSSKTPAGFRSVATDVNIEFKLAVRDPDGAPTNGIVRVNGKRTTWYFDDGDEMKKLSYWPSKDYLNIWVVTLGNSTLGYSQFPTSDNLPGLEEGSNIEETDGVVIYNRYFGRGGNTSQNSRGRTLTHEVGHYLGLKHVWGDDDNACSGDDFIADTPNQAGPHNICPGFPNSSCGNTSDMFMNFLDYSPDTCMNLFTKGQKERMRVILENSPRRKSLLTSKALTAPVLSSLDGAVTRITNPFISVCSNTIEPSFYLRNLGTATLNSATIGYSLNGSTFVYTNRTFSLPSLDTATLIFPALTLQDGPGLYKLKIEVKNPNGGDDENKVNDTLSINFYYSPTAALPFAENFEGPSTFYIRNIDGQKKWQTVSVPISGNPNRAAYMDLFNNQKIINDLDYLITPTFSAKNIDSLGLSFRYAYAQKDVNSNDALMVRISTDCGVNFLKSNEIYFNIGGSLATTPPKSNAFFPDQPGQWKVECINLEKYIGLNNLQIAFISSSGMGNNIFLDDIEIKYTTCNNSTPVAVDEEPLSDSRFAVYPNPSDGELFVDLKLLKPEDVNIKVFDPLGHELYSEKFLGVKSLHKPLHFQQVSSGVYFIKIEGNKINLKRKVIIQK